MASSPEEIRKHQRLYLMIGAVLFVMTVVTVLMSYVHLGSHSLNILVGMIIAAFKSSLVILIFMHLNNERGIIYRFLLFTVIFALGLAFLTLFAYWDPIVDRTFFK